MKTKLAMATLWITYNLIVLLLSSVIMLLVTSAVSAAQLSADRLETELTAAVKTVADETVAVKRFDLPTMLVAKSYLGTKKIWKWTPKAEHHKAIVRVTANGSGGTGVYFTTGKIAGILTAMHVVDGRGPCKITWPDGRVDISTHRVPSDRKGHQDDLAVILLPKLRTDVQPIAVTKRDTYTGECLEVTGYGGPGAHPGEHTLRHFEVYQSKSNPDRDLAKPGAMHGDSGGPIFSFQDGKPYIASVVSAGTSSTNKKQSISGGTASWYDDVHYASTNRLVGFLDFIEQSLTATTPSSDAKIFRSRSQPSPRVIPRVCPPGGCPPDNRGGDGGDNNGGGDYELYPPEGCGQNEIEAHPVPPIAEPSDEQGSGAAGPLLVLLAVIASVAVAFHKRAFE